MSASGGGAGRSTFATWTVAGAVSIAAGTLMVFFSANTDHFVPNACAQIDAFVSPRVVGQHLAVDQMVDAVCTHLAKPDPSRPLIIGVHGPPGVGKTHTHTLLARALYNKDPASAAKCPGEDCAGAKVIYGMNFLLEEQQEQLAAVRAAILEHTRRVSDPLIVIEEYDKLDCESRGMLRQLLSTPDSSEGSLGRAIVLLESNVGFSELEEMLAAVGDREKITAEAAEKALREVVFSSWVRASCEPYPDTLKFVSMVDFFLPYFPLQRPQVEQMLELSLAQWGATLWNDKHTRLAWGADVVAFLADRVDFDGPFPLEGGKQVPNVATRYVSRIVRTAPPAPPAAARTVATASSATKSRGRSSVAAAAAAATGPGAVPCGGGSGTFGALSGGLSCGPGTSDAPELRLVAKGNALVVADDAQQLQPGS